MFRGRTQTVQEMQKASGKQCFMFTAGIEVETRARCCRKGTFRREKVTKKFECHEINSVDGLEDAVEPSIQEMVTVAKRQYNI